MPIHKSGAWKRNKRKRENQLIEAQRGSINKYFSVASSVDVNRDNQRRESEHRQDVDQNSMANHEDDSK